MAAVPANATLLKVTISASLTTITQRVSLKLPKVTRTAIETTDLDSTWDTIIVGLKRSEPFEFVLNWDPAETTHAYLWTSVTGGVLEVWQFVMADGGAATIGFSGYVLSDESQDIAVDGLVRKTFTVKPTGAITLTP